MILTQRLRVMYNEETLVLKDSESVVGVRGCQKEFMKLWSISEI